MFSTHLIPADHFVSNVLLLWWETVLAVGHLEDELLNVLYSGILGSCSTDLDSLVGLRDCRSMNTSLSKGLGEDIADVERFPSLAAGMKESSLLLPSTSKEKLLPILLLKNRVFQCCLHCRQWMCLNCWLQFMLEAVVQKLRPVCVLSPTPADSQAPSSFLTAPGSLLVSFIPSHAC